MNGMSNNDLVNLLRSGNQEPVQVIFNSVRSLEKLCGIVAEQIEVDSLDLINLLRDDEYITPLGFTRSTILGMFIPNTYEMYWNSSASDFIERMEREYRQFWTEERKQKAEGLGLTTHEVSIIASIIDEETNKNDEKPINISLDERPGSFQLTPDGSLLLVSTGDSALKVWNTVTGHLETSYHANEKLILSQVDEAGSFTAFENQVGLHHLRIHNYRSMTKNQ